MTIRIRHAWVLSAVLGPAAACGGRELPLEAPEVPELRANAADAPLARPSAANPLQTLEPTAADFEGVVVARIRTGSYAYLHVDTGAKSQWVATMGSGRPRGSHVHVASLGVRHDFHSRRLDRDFDTLVFASIEDAATNGDDR